MPTPLSLEELLDRLEAVAVVNPASAAIGVRDPEVARYARALEYGSIAGQPPWPRPGARTTVGVDPETGVQVVVSAQAPQGFIRVQAPQFPALVAEALAAPADWLDGTKVQLHLQRAVKQASEVALERLRAVVPRDSGRLAQSLEALTE